MSPAPPPDTDPPPTVLQQLPRKQMTRKGFVSLHKVAFNQGLKGWLSLTR